MSNTPLPTDVCNKYGLPQSATVEDLEAALAEHRATQSILDQSFDSRPGTTAIGRAMPALFEYCIARLQYLEQEFIERGEAVDPNFDWAEFMDAQILRHVGHHLANRQYDDPDDEPGALVWDIHALLELILKRDQQTIVEAIYMYADIQGFANDLKTLLNQR